MERNRARGVVFRRAEDKGLQPAPSRSIGKPRRRTSPRKTQQAAVVCTQIEVKLKKASPVRWSALEGDGTAEAAVVMESAENVAQKREKTLKSGKDWDAIVVDIKKEEAEEKPEGDAALNALFQKIYGDGALSGLPSTSLSSSPPLSLTPLFAPGMTRLSGQCIARHNCPCPFCQLVCTMSHGGLRGLGAAGDDATKRAMMKSYQESGGTVLSTNWGEVGAGKVEMKPPDGMEYKQYEQ